MNKTIIGVIAFAGGVVVGAVGGAYIMKKKCSKGEAERVDAALKSYKESVSDYMEAIRNTPEEQPIEKAFKEAEPVKDLNIPADQPLPVNYATAMASQEEINKLKTETIYNIEPLMMCNYDERDNSLDVDRYEGITLCYSTVDDEFVEPHNGKIYDESEGKVPRELLNWDKLGMCYIRNREAEIDFEICKVDGPAHSCLHYDIPLAINCYEDWTNPDVENSVQDCDPFDDWDNPPYDDGDGDADESDDW